MYDTAKAAETQMVKSLAADVGPKIRVNMIHPGIVETDALRKVFEDMQLTAEMRDAMTQTVRLRRNGTPDDIAAAALYLASEAGSYVTGTELHVSGGPVDERRSQFPDL
jgi:7-alpha-hydroxysteroid dehydrogenase